jgi:hypothetical protein
MKKWEDFYDQNFTPWDSGKPEPHLVAAFAFRAKEFGLSVTFPEYSSDEDETTSSSLPDGSENDIFDLHIQVRVSTKSSNRFEESHEVNRKWFRVKIYQKWSLLIAASMIAAQTCSTQ